MEKRDLYDAKRKLTGETIFRDEQIPDGKYIVVVLIFIQNSEGEFLIQKRSKKKNGKFATTGGHPKSGESSIQGIITEVKEEIGLELDPNEVQLYFSGKSDEDRVFFDAYYVKKDIEDVKKLKLQEDEVSSVQWLSINEIQSLMKQNKFFKNHYEEFENLLKWLKGDYK